MISFRSEKSYQWRKRVSRFLFFLNLILIIRSIPKQQDVFVTEVNTAYGLTVFSQNTSVNDPPSDYLRVYDTPQQ